MSLIRTFVFAIAAVLLFATPRAFAQQETTVSSRGMAKVSDWVRLDPLTRREALMKAKISALENYIAEGGAARQKLYEQQRQHFLDNLDRYVLSTTTLSEEEDKKAKTYSMVIRADINATLVQTTLDAGSATTATASGGRSLLTFVFVSRQQDTAQSFDDKVYKRAEATRSYGEKTSEGESIRGNLVSTNGSREESVSASSTTGGSVTRRSDSITWKVANANEINTAMTGLFSAAGYEVVEAEYVESESNGLLSVDRIRKDFGSGDDLSSATLRDTANGVRTAGIPYLAYGTLDVGMRDRDPVSGNVRVTVTVAGKLLDVSGRFPKTVSSVGPVQYAGLGADESIARTNALKDAAEKTAQQMVNELNVRAVH
jgi:hypothetical protein